MEDEWWPPYEHAGEGEPHQRRDQMSWLADNDGRVLVDFVGKVEQLDIDFGKVCDEIGLPRTALPRVNRSNHKYYREAYDQQMVDFVATYHSRDIEKYGYEF
jgi:hypothetical protein